MTAIQFRKVRQRFWPGNPVQFARNASKRRFTRASVRTIASSSFFPSYANLSSSLRSPPPILNPTTPDTHKSTKKNCHFFITFSVENLGKRPKQLSESLFLRKIHRKSIELSWGWGGVGGSKWEN